MKFGIAIVWLILLLTAGCITENHLEFESVPVNGNLDSFALKLQNKGFIRLSSPNANPLIMNGIYLNANCRIYLFGSVQSRSLYKVDAEMPVARGDTLRKNFESLQKLFNGMYDIGKSRYRQYQNPERYSRFKDSKFDIQIFNNPQSTIHNPQSTIHNPQSTIHNPQSTIPTPQSPLPNPQSPIPTPQSLKPALLLYKPTTNICWQTTVKWMQAVVEWMQ